MQPHPLGSIAPRPPACRPCAELTGASQAAVLHISAHQLSEVRSCPDLIHGWPPARAPKSLVFRIFAPVCSRFSRLCGLGASVIDMLSIRVRGRMEDVHRARVSPSARRDSPSHQVRGTGREPVSGSRESRLGRKGSSRPPRCGMRQQVLVYGGAGAGSFSLHNLVDSLRSALGAQLEVNFSSGSKGEWRAHPEAL